MFRPLGHIEKTHVIRETNEIFLLKIEDKKYIYEGDTVFTFETVDDIDEYFSEIGHNDVNYPFALSKENIYYMIYQKYVTIDDFVDSKMGDCRRKPPVTA